MKTRLKAMSDYINYRINTEEKFFFESIEKIIDILVSTPNKLYLFGHADDDGDVYFEEEYLSRNCSILACLRYIGWLLIFNPVSCDNQKIALFVETAVETGMAYMIAAIYDCEERDRCLIGMSPRLNDFVELLRIKSRERFLVNN
jgi:hypothetical protein